MLKYSHTRKDFLGNGDVPAGVQRVIDLHTADKLDYVVYDDLLEFVKHYKFATTSYSKAELVAKAANIIDANASGPPPAVDDGLGVMPAPLSQTQETEVRAWV